MSMNLHRLSSRLPGGMGAALAAFEREFSYPLGSSGRFRISHGEDYLPFFQAMGEAELLLLEEAGVVQGVLARVGRTLELRSEAGVEKQMAHYLCDLKLRAAARGSLALPRLIRETKRVIEGSGSHCCYCVVMEGTGKLPTDYTGRLGVPRFQRLGEIAILRIGAGGQRSRGVATIEPEDFARLRSGVAPYGYSATGSQPALRSLMEPLHLATTSGDACGILEDTRRGKRLFLEEGPEMLSAHLSRFAFSDAKAGADLLGAAASLAADRGMAGVFVAVPRSAGDALLRELGDVPVTVAPAAIYGHALEAGVDWWINTAEI